MLEDPCHVTHLRCLFDYKGKDRIPDLKGRMRGGAVVDNRAPRKLTEFPSPSTTAIARTSFPRRLNIGFHIFRNMSLQRTCGERTNIGYSASTIILDDNDDDNDFGWWWWMWSKVEQSLCDKEAHRERGSVPRRPLHQPGEIATTAELQRRRCWS